MTYIVLLNLRVVFFFDCFFIESFENILMRSLIIGNIIVYCIKLRVIKNCLV